MIDGDDLLQMACAEMESVLRDPGVPMPAHVEAWVPCCKCRQRHCAVRMLPRGRRAADCECAPCRNAERLLAAVKGGQGG